MSHNELDHRHYVIMDVSEISKLEFSEVMETSEDTLRFSNDGTKTFVKYGHHSPHCLEECTSKSESYSHHDFLEILSGPEWDVDLGGGLHGS
jgi:hypothetical protein